MANPPYPVDRHLILVGRVQVFVVAAAESPDQGIRAGVEENAEQEEDLCRESEFVFSLLFWFLS